MRRATVIINAVFSLPVDVVNGDTVDEVVARYQDQWVNEVSQAIEPWTEPAGSSRVDLDRITYDVEVVGLEPFPESAGTGWSADSGEL